MKMESSQGLNNLRQALALLVQNGSFDNCLDKVRVISGGHDHCVCEMTVEQRHVNIMGTLHGGCTATLVDIVSSLPIFTFSPQLIAVTANLNVSYLSAVKLGEDIVIEAKNEKVGRNLAFLDVVIKRKSDGQLVATGKHTKFISVKTSQSAKSVL